jgi:hypothetical protein
MLSGRMLMYGAVTRLGSMSATGLASSTAPPSPQKSSATLKRNV